MLVRLVPMRYLVLLTLSAPLYPVDSFVVLKAIQITYRREDGKAHKQYFFRDEGDGKPELIIPVSRRQAPDFFLLVGHSPEMLIQECLWIKVKIKDFLDAEVGALYVAKPEDRLGSPAIAGGDFPRDFATRKEKRPAVAKRSP